MSEELFCPDERRARREIAEGIAAAVRRREEEARELARASARRRHDHRAYWRQRQERQGRKPTPPKRLSRVHPLGLTPQQDVLLRLLLATPLTMKELEAAMGLTETTVRGILTLLRSRLKAHGSDVKLGYHVVEAGRIAEALGAE